VTFGYHVKRRFESMRTWFVGPVRGDLAVAKRKTPNHAKSSGASASRGRSASDNGPAPAAGKSPGVATQLAFSPHDIGNVAGEIWGLLTNNGEQTLAALKKSVDAPPELVLAAIGWLAREDKLEFATTGKTVKISLR
jgi:hypothetical protein